MWNFELKMNGNLCECTTLTGGRNLLHSTSELVMYHDKVRRAFFYFNFLSLTLPSQSIIFFPFIFYFGTRTLSLWGRWCWALYFIFWDEIYGYRFQVLLLTFLYLEVISMNYCKVSYKICWALFWARNRRDFYFNWDILKLSQGASARHITSKLCFA